MSRNFRNAVIIFQVMSVILKKITKELQGLTANSIHSIEVE